MEEKMNEVCEKLLLESRNKFMRFDMNWDTGNPKEVSVTASPAALKLLAAKLIEASTQPLDSEVEIDLDKHFGEQTYPGLLSVMLTDEKAEVKEVAESSMFWSIGCAAIAFLVFLTFLLGVQKLYEIIS